jgi:hypothetical protein
VRRDGLGFVAIALSVIRGGRGLEPEMAQAARLRTQTLVRLRLTR